MNGGDTCHRLRVTHLGISCRRGAADVCTPARAAGGADLPAVRRSRRCPAAACMAGAGAGSAVAAVGGRADASQHSWRNVCHPGQSCLCRRAAAARAVHHAWHCGSHCHHGLYNLLVLLAGSPRGCLVKRNRPSISNATVVRPVLCEEFQPRMDMQCKCSSEKYGYCTACRFPAWRGNGNRSCTTTRCLCLQARRCWSPACGEIVES